jgi:hypothetical protein
MNEKYAYQCYYREDKNEDIEQYQVEEFVVFQ